MAKIRSADPIDAYEFHRQSCIAAAQTWERAAEIAYKAGDPIVGANCNGNARRLRWLAEPDEDLRKLFNVVDRLLDEQQTVIEDAPRD